MSEEQILNTEVTEQEQVTTPDYSYIPEKFRTYKADSEDLDLDTTLSKLHKSYSELEKKLSSKGVISKSEVKEIDTTAFDEGFITNNTDLLELAKEAGLDTDTFKKFADKYDEKIKSVLEHKEIEDYDTTINSLESLWGKETEQYVDYANNAIIKLGFTEDEILAVQNNIPFIKLAAEFGKQLGEHKAPNTNGEYSGSLKELMTSEAYSNSKHPDHKTVKSQVAELYAQGFSLKKG